MTTVTPWPLPDDLAALRDALAPIRASRLRLERLEEPLLIELDRLCLRRCAEEGVDPASDEGAEIREAIIVLVNLDGAGDVFNFTS